MQHSRSILLVDSVKASHEALVIHAEKMTKLGSKVVLTSSGWQDNKAVLIVGGLVDGLRTFHIDANVPDSAFAVMAIIKKLILDSARDHQPAILHDYVHVKPKPRIALRLMSFIKKNVFFNASARV